MVGTFIELVGLVLVSIILVSCQPGTALPALDNPTQYTPSPIALTIEPITPVITVEAGTSFPQPSAMNEISPALYATPTPLGLSQEMDALIPPIPPAQLQAQRIDSDILLTWIGTGSDIDTHDVVYRHYIEGDQWEMLAFIAVQGDNRGAYSYLDAVPPPGGFSAYAISTVNHYGKESAPTSIELDWNE